MKLHSLQNFPPTIAYLVRENIVVFWRWKHVGRFKCWYITCSELKRFFQNVGEIPFQQLCEDQVEFLLCFAVTYSSNRPYAGKEEHPWNDKYTLVRSLFWTSKFIINSISTLNYTSKVTFKKWVQLMLWLSFQLRSFNQSGEVAIKQFDEIWHQMMLTHLQWAVLRHDLYRSNWGYKITGYYQWMFIR